MKNKKMDKKKASKGNRTTKIVIISAIIAIALILSLINYASHYYRLTVTHADPVICESEITNHTGCDESGNISNYINEFEPDKISFIYSSEGFISNIPLDLRKEIKESTDNYKQKYPAEREFNDTLFSIPGNPSYSHYEMKLSSMNMTGLIELIEGSVIDDVRFTKNNTLVFGYTVNEGRIYFPEDLSA